MFTLKLNRNRQTKPMPTQLEISLEDVIERFITNTMMASVRTAYRNNNKFVCYSPVAVSFARTHVNVHHADVLLAG